VHSTCDGKVQKCIGRGPGWPDHFTSTRIIAERQVKKAEELSLKSDVKGGKLCAF
jgi:neutral ceramidase